jgi:hypothetical protein
MKNYDWIFSRVAEAKLRGETHIDLTDADVGYIEGLFGVTEFLKENGYEYNFYPSGYISVFWDDVDDPVIFLKGNMSDGFSAFGPYSSYDHASSTHDGDEGWMMSLNGYHEKNSNEGSFGVDYSYEGNQ